MDCPQVSYITFNLSKKTTLSLINTIVNNQVQGWFKQKSREIEIEHKGSLRHYVQIISISHILTEVPDLSVNDEPAHVLSLLITYEVKKLHM